jgi:hypothetical protein
VMFELLDEFARIHGLGGELDRLLERCAKLDRPVVTRQSHIRAPKPKTARTPSRDRGEIG